MMRFVGAPLLLSMLLVAQGAAASEVFDSVIKSELGLPHGPLLCTVCHASLIGGVGTVIQPFGRRAMQLGLQKLDVENLKRVLREMEATNVDSDCDGIGDIAELKAQSDPNRSEADANSSEGDACVAASFDPPRHGFYCSLTRLPTNERVTAFPFAIFLLALLHSRRQTRKGAPRSAPGDCAAAGRR